MDVNGSTRLKSAVLSRFVTCSTGSRRTQVLRDGGVSNYVPYESHSGELVKDLSKVATLELL